MKRTMYMQSKWISSNARNSKGASQLVSLWDQEVFGEAYLTSLAVLTPRQLQVCLFVNSALWGEPTQSSLALHHAGAESLDRLQIVGVGSLHWNGDFFLKTVTRK